MVTLWLGRHGQAVCARNHDAKPRGNRHSSAVLRCAGGRSVATDRALPAVQADKHGEQIIPNGVPGSAVKYLPHRGQASFNIVVID
ncbi:MAG: hypothetical protein HQL87_09830 [Magnetococcales bacterium]|nr:hypothetical protein [Magnetococcales bacterium]